jgi:hypothetical protein
MAMARQISTIIIGVLVFGLLLGYGVRWAAEAGDRATNDPRYRRRMLGLCGVVYIVVGIFIIVEVAVRKEPVQVLYGLPIGVIIAWLLFRAVTKTKVPPKQ